MLISFWTMNFQISNLWEVNVQQSIFKGRETNLNLFSRIANKKIYIMFLLSSKYYDTICNFVRKFWIMQNILSRNIIKHMLIPSTRNFSYVNLIAPAKPTIPPLFEWDIFIITDRCLTAHITFSNLTQLRFY